MRRIVEERITDREEIYETLQDFGTGYVVIEEKNYESRPLKWLREIVKPDRFFIYPQFFVSGYH